MLPNNTKKYKKNYYTYTRVHKPNFAAMEKYHKKSAGHGRTI